MNKSESKYFNTALLMDEALISLLSEKDLEYITVKEICEKAGVNRSTFYLHYETIDDLLSEAAETVSRRFASYFPQNSERIVENIENRSLNELIFITEEFLVPYLRFIKENKNVYRASFRNPRYMQAHFRYGNLKKFVIEPVLNKFRVPQEYQSFYIAYYVEGVMAIIKEWLNTNCSESEEMIADIIIECVKVKNIDNGE